MAVNPIRRLWGRRQEKKAADASLKAFAEAAAAFAVDHPDAFILMGDPATDTIFMAYQGIIAPARIMNRDGSRNFIVRNMLRHGKNDADIDRFLMAVDGGVYNIAKALYSQKRKKFAGKMLSWVMGDVQPAESALTLADGSVLSPLQVVDKDGNAL